MQGEMKSGAKMTVALTLKDNVSARARALQTHVASVPQLLFSCCAQGVRDVGQKIKEKLLSILGDIKKGLVVSGRVLWADRCT
jgi:hypothetical protein